VIQSLEGAAGGALALRGRRIGVQLYGAEPNPELVDFLTAAGARVESVAPYRYADGAATAEIAALLRQLREGEIDAIAFTSKSQVERLFAAAGADEVRAALAATQVAAIGPVVAATLAAKGVAVATMPETSWFMKPLTAALVAELQT